MEGTWRGRSRSSLRLPSACFGAATARTGRGAQERLELFDAHMHYNQEPNPFYPLDKVLEIFGATASPACSPPAGRTRAPINWWTPRRPGSGWCRSSGPIASAADIQTWFSDPAILELIKDEYKRGYYRGVGEFHISGKPRPAPLVKQIVDFAVERDSTCTAHCDETALLHLFAHNPRARIIWAHTGFSTAPARVRGTAGADIPRCGANCPIAAASPTAPASSAPNGASCSTRHSERFLIGSDTWINERWFGYDTIFQNYRAWLAQLPADQARQHRQRQRQAAVRA